MDSIDPISAAFARGGRLIMLEHMADYAQNPYSGIRYFESVERKLGRAETAEFARLYTAPGVDHVGSGAPANVDMLSVLVDRVEKGTVPGDVEVAEQKVAKSLENWCAPPPPAAFTRRVSITAIAAKHQHHPGHRETPKFHCVSRRRRNKSALNGSPS